MEGGDGVYRGGADIMEGRCVLHIDGVGGGGVHVYSIQSRLLRFSALGGRTLCSLWARTLLITLVVDAARIGAVHSTTAHRSPHAYIVMPALMETAPPGTRIPNTPIVA
eukprot:EC788224.1.p1 GENE.EC788224.1~~EC788224.1.p1  ORF type:complete len:109 (+),score=11.45 EC788224.1:94-420(+)